MDLSTPAPYDPAAQRDPWAWCALIALAFLALLWLRLGIPSRISFDEVHYVKAAKVLLTMQKPINPEHPLVGKEILAAGIRLFGDTPQGWRTFPALFGTLGLYAFSRALWLASRRTLATVAGTLLLASNFMWFVISRIAILDVFMAAFCMLAMWMLAGAVRVPGQARWRLALAGVFLGLALGAKWNAVAVAALPGLAFLWLRLRRHRGRFMLASDGPPIEGISLAEGALWLGTVPLLVYFALMWGGAMVLTRTMRFRYPQATAVSFTAAGNNFELAIAVAIGVFGVTSGQALAGVVGPLIEVPALVGLVYVGLWARRFFPDQTPHRAPTPTSPSPGGDR